MATKAENELRHQRDDVANAFRIQREAWEQERNQLNQLKVENLTLRRQADDNRLRMQQMENHIVLIEHQLSIVRQVVYRAFALEGVSQAGQGGVVDTEPQLLKRPRT